MKQIELSRLIDVIGDPYFMIDETWVDAGCDGTPITDAECELEMIVYHNDKGTEREIAEAVSKILNYVTDLNKESDETN